MNIDQNENLAKPSNVSDDEWFAIDLNDPLMWVC